MSFKLKKKFSQLVAENLWSRIGIACLTALSLMLAIAALSRDTVVVMKPPLAVPGEQNSYWVSNKAASESYLRSWGLFMGMMLGNVTPTTVNFLKDQLTPLLGPGIYHDVVNILEIQAQQIRDDNITMRFEPKYIEYEKDSDKVFVYGYSFVKAMDGDENRDERTYEFQIEIADHLVRFNHFDTYDSRPKNARVLQQIKRREASRKERDRKHG